MLSSWTDWLRVAIRSTSARAVTRVRTWSWAWSAEFAATIAPPAVITADRAMLPAIRGNSVRIGHDRIDIWLWSFLTGRWAPLGWRRPERYRQPGSGAEAEGQGAFGRVTVKQAPAMSPGR